MSYKIGNGNLTKYCKYISEAFLLNHNKIRLWLRRNIGEFILASLFATILAQYQFFFSGYLKLLMVDEIIKKIQNLLKHLM